MIWSFVKGEEDFGRNPIDDTRATFEAILCSIPVLGDLMLYLYPEANSHLLYRIDSISEIFAKDLPYIITGTMTRLRLADQPTQLHNEICMEMNRRVGGVVYKKRTNERL